MASQMYHQNQVPTDLGDSCEQVLDKERREPLAFEDETLLFLVEEKKPPLVIASISTRSFSRIW